MSRVDPIYNIDSYAKISKYRIQRANSLAKSILEKIKLRNKHYFDKNARPIEVELGERIWAIVEPYKNLKPIYDGSYTIIEIIQM